jgi:hypothetical protein
MTNSKIKFFHSELLEWKKTIEFYSHQLVAFQNRLTEVAKNNSNRQMLAEVEQFQNKFIVEKESFDILRHDIKAQAKKIVLAAPDYDDIKEDFVDEQFILADRFQTAESLFGELKKSFYRFLEKYSMHMEEKAAESASLA